MNNLVNKLHLSSLVFASIVATAPMENLFAADTCKNLFSKNALTLMSKVATDQTIEAVPFEDSYNFALAADLAKTGQYIRRPKASEIEVAIKNGLFPDTSEIRTSMMVLQIDKMDYNAPGKLVIATGSHTPRKWNENFDFENVAKQMKRQIEQNLVVNEISLSIYRDTLSDLEGTSTNVGGNKADRIKLITLKDGTRGIFKAATLNQAVAETASYLFARALGLNLVPPTVVVNYQGQIGSFQYFIENPGSGINKSHGSQSAALISKEDMANMELFYITSGNWDAHPGNRIIDLNGGLGLIDNEAITRPQFYRYGEVPWFMLSQKGKYDKADFETPASKDFPFEKTKYFNKPQLADISALTKNLEGYDADLIKSKISWYQQDSGRIGVVDWNNSLWLQLNIPEYYRPRIPSFFPENTMRKASALTMADLENIFQKPFEIYGGQNIFKSVDLSRIKDRLDEVTKEWQRQSLK